MTNLIAIIFLNLFALQLTPQQEFEAQSEAFIESMLDGYRVIETDAEINRHASLGASWSKRIELKSNALFLNKYDQKDYQEYTFTFLFFEDNSSCMKARQDYLDHFSSDGKLTPETKGIKRPPSFNLITENSIIIFEVSCEGYQMDEKWSWNSLKRQLVSTFGSEDSEVIENGCGGPIKWINNRDE